MESRTLLKLAIGFGLAVVVVPLLIGMWLFWKRPLTVDAWMSRLALGKRGLQASELATPAGTMTVWEGGSGPAMVLLHGAGDQAGAWARIMEPLVADYRVLAPDLPGHWKSDPRTGPITVGQLLDGLEALMDARCAGEPAILVGNSMGAWIAFLYAVEHPQRVARLVAINGGPITDEYTGVNILPRNREEARAAMKALLGPNTVLPPDFVLDDVVRQAKVGSAARLAQGLPHVGTRARDDRPQRPARPGDGAGRAGVGRCRRAVHDELCRAPDRGPSGRPAPSGEGLRPRAPPRVPGPAARGAHRGAGRSAAAGCCGGGAGGRGMIHGDLLGERARVSPERTALVTVADGRRYSYRELDQRAVRCARMWLYGLGLRPGERVAILSGNRVEMLDAFFAAGKSGVVLVPLSTRLTANELEQIVRDSGSRALIYDGEHRGVVRRLRPRVEVDFWLALDERDRDDDLDVAEMVLTRGAGSSVHRRCRPRTRTACSTPRAPPAARRGLSPPTARSRGTPTTPPPAGSSARPTAARSSRRCTTPAGSARSWRRCCWSAAGSCCTRPSTRPRCGG